MSGYVIRSVRTRTIWPGEKETVREEEVYFFQRFVGRSILWVKNKKQRAVYAKKEQAEYHHKILNRCAQDTCVKPKPVLTVLRVKGKPNAKEMTHGQKVQTTQQPPKKKAVIKRKKSPFAF